ncbi:hypothetical protein COU77_00765 [Candidatus Peregrinibacteria bacterium CG10_big_fil_rev_8_21_14_0_10_49_16]|nr:MAG: hypothetical protein COW95_03025 [Candidatus Peregrinibacteria bacterium CG22_combo_CG10-13_8_21_14_all_49_11]PIR52358.1 MAG: hypothetical protein COU77_00765 [Candidatus Peregrinibacteria bacterium CG10_big_fil_rev_8_21_14_0_10_49_16]
MWLRSLALEHFRNYQSQQFDFSVDTDVHLLLGENGSGKTNILEAIALLALTRSCRFADDEDMVLWDAHYFRVQGMIECIDGTKKTLECVYQRQPRRKAFFVNGVRTSTTQFIGSFPVSVFLPQDLSLFSGSPGQRRQFFDRILCQVLPEYFRHFLTYAKVLKQRNALLRRVAHGEMSQDSLLFWDRELAESGSVLTLSRLELLETLNVALREELAGFGVRWESASLSLKRATVQRSKDALIVEFLQCLQDTRTRDLALLHTTVGPHREDWSLEVNGRNIAVFASRGQQRLCLLALLFLQLSYIELRCGEKPVVLLDDVSSELDEEHQECVLRMLDGHQVFVSGVHPFEAFAGAVWHVSSGSCEAPNSASANASAASSGRGISVR